MSSANPTSPPAVRRDGDFLPHLPRSLRLPRHCKVARYCSELTVCYLPYMPGLEDLAARTPIEML